MASTTRPAGKRIALLLQGGGALGAYQAGIYQALEERGLAPDWVAGTSIGAINGAIIAGNPAGERLERLHEFWRTVALPDFWGVHGLPQAGRQVHSAWSFMAAALTGRTGFFSPRWPALHALNSASPETASYYDTAPLRRLLDRLVDFDRLAVLIPPPRRHRHRYHGVLAPNAPLRGAVTARAGLPMVESRRDLTAQPSTAAAAKLSPETAPAETSRPPSRYLWAMLLARIYEVFPLLCPQCGEPIRIIAFITESAAIQRILMHIGEPTQPPPIASARGPPSWEEFDQRAGLDPVTAEPFPAYEFDQTVSG